MKTASPTLTALINSNAFFDVLLCQITLTGGQVIRLAATEFDVIDPATGNVYSCGAMGSGNPKLDHGKSRVQITQKRGLDSDSATIAIVPSVMDQVTGAMTYPDVVGSIPWQTAIRIGLFDNADIVLSRAYFSGPPTIPWSAATRTAVGLVIVFRGVIGDIDGTQAQTTISIDDYRKALGVQMPRNYYQASCRHQLFDSGCTLLAAFYAVNKTALAGSTKAAIVASLAPPAGSGTFALGRLLFTSGQNSGFSRTIQSSDNATYMTLTSPLPFTPAPGDAFTAYPGCDKTMATCNAFGNILNYGGEAYIPAPEVSVG